MFSSNDTPAEEYEYAAKIGATINLDDITHIDFLDKILDGKFPETMSCVIIRVDFLSLVLQLWIIREMPSMV